MNLKEYFENTTGLGILSTSDDKGKVNSAIYARPHIMDNSQAAFIMADKLTHTNLQKNFNACYLFKQEGKGYIGRRLYLKKLGETQDKKEIDSLRRSCHDSTDKDKKKKFLVFFKIEKDLPLIDKS